MNGLSSLFVLIVLIGIIVFSLFYLQARQRAKNYHHEKRKFTALSGNLLKLKENITTEADRWPIYARPIMFTDIDHDAQIEFAKAQQALIDANEIVPLIDTIPEPKTPEHFSVANLLNIPKNLETIFIGVQLSGKVNDLEQNIIKLRNSLAALRTNRKGVEKKRLDVEESIEVLKERAERIHKKLKPLDVWRTIENHNLTWLVSTADRCLFDANNSIKNLSDNDQGYMEHARADILVIIGSISLDCLELFLESQKISRRYELDKFEQQFNESTRFLQSILEMDDVWTSWRKLKTVKPYVDALPRTRQQAEKSLRSFQNRQKHFEELIGRTSHIDLEEEIRSINILEKECVYYWYSYAERKTYWEKSLGTPPSFPSKELNGFQTLLVTEINPEIDVDMVIKQSKLLDLINKVGAAIEWHDSIQFLKIRLNDELTAHKEAQKLVKELLRPQGDATLVLQELRPILEDTSPDIVDWGEILVSDYQSYSDRERKVRGADFPELLDSLKQFIVQSRKLIREHYSKLKELESEYTDLYDYIDSLNHELQIYINHIPKFDKDSVNIFMKALEESNNILKEHKIEKYSWLRPAVNQMLDWSEKTNTLIAPARTKYEAFESLRARVDELLLQTEEAMNVDKYEDESSWSWSKNEILPRVKAAAQSYNRRKGDWDRLVTRNWAEYSIARAISQCESLIKFCESKLLELGQASDRIYQKQNQLDNKVRDIDYFLEHNIHQLPLDDVNEIYALVTIARQTENYEYADRLLNYAHSLAVRRTNPKTRREIREIIINSEGGPVFLDQVNNRGKINGSTRLNFYTKQKGRRRNEKK